MADNFDNIPLVYAPGKNITFSINYFIQQPPKSSGRRIQCKLDLPMLVELDEITVEKPRIRPWGNEFSKAILTSFLPLMGSNVYVTSVSITGSDDRCFQLPLDRIGSGSRMASSKSMFFSLSTEDCGPTQRVYVKGGSLVFEKANLSSVEEKETIYNFELLFTSTVLLFDRKLALRYNKSNKSVVAAVFRGFVSFQRKPLIKPKPKPKPRSKPKPKVTSNARIIPKVMT